MQALQRPAELYSQDDDEIDLRHLWHVVRQSWGGILGLCIVVSLLTVLWVMRIDPVYRASTTIMIESQEAKTVSIEEVYGQPPGIREYFLTQFEIIRNRDVAERVADELDLWNNPLFLRTNYLLTGIWAVVFSSNALLAWQRGSHPVLPAWLYETINYCLLVGAMFLSTWYPAHLRRKREADRTTTT